MNREQKAVDEQARWEAMRQKIESDVDWGHARSARLTAPPTPPAPDPLLSCLQDAQAKKESARSRQNARNARAQEMRLHKMMGHLLNKGDAAT